MWHGVENAGLENAGPCGTGWKTRDWKTQDLKSMERVTIRKSQSYGAEIKTVYGGLVTMLKASIHQSMAASAAAANLSPAGSPVGTRFYWYTDSEPVR